MATAAARLRHRRASGSLAVTGGRYRGSKRAACPTGRDMPRGQPFTTLCQQLAERRPGDRVDLHIHTTCSDGAYTPAEVVDLGRRSGLPALAITDHDTIAALRS